MFSSNSKWGYTVVELMVTVVIVAVLAATIGIFVAKLLTLHENEREDAYIREKLADICGAYADLVSIGSSSSTNLRNVIVAYRPETGGVSLETGVVSHVTSLVSSLNTGNWTENLSAYGGTNVLRSFRMNGDADLIPLMGDVVSFEVSPLDALNLESASLVNLRVRARYRVKNENGDYEIKTTEVERIVRLWNHE